MASHEDGDIPKISSAQLHGQLVAAAEAAQAAQAQQQAAEVANVVNGAAAAIQAAAAVAAASAWASATAAAAATAGTGEGGSSEDMHEGMEVNNKYSKMRRAAWTTDEESRLTELANRYASAGQRMCWRLIAQELGTGRTSKQCREHYLNSLRPNMKKGQWTQREEYIIAREHAKNGSHWCVIAKKLPGRTDNSIKNFYNATVRSKAVAKHESFLWLYVDKIQRSGLPPRDALAVATEIWSASVSPALVNEVLNEDGAEALMLLSGKRKGDDETLAGLMNQAGRMPGNQSLASLLPDSLQQLLGAGMKRDRDQSQVTPEQIAYLIASGGMNGLDELAKRQKMDPSAIARNAAASAAKMVAGGGAENQQDRQRQELLQQLGIVGAGTPAAQPGPPAAIPPGPIDLGLLQQQLLLQQLLTAATNNNPAATTPGSTSAPPANGAPSSGGAYSPAPANLVSLLQQITAQSVLLSATHQQQQQQQPAGGAGLQQLMSPGGGNAMDNNSLMSLLGVQESAGMAQPDAAAAAIAAAAAAGLEVKQELGPDGMPLSAPAYQQFDSAAHNGDGSEHQALQAAAAAHAQAQEHQAMHAAASAQAQDNAMMQHQALQQALGMAGMSGLQGISADALLASLPSSDMGHGNAHM